MKIYFTASVRGKSKYIKNYEKIVEILKKEGHKVLADHIFNTNKELLQIGDDVIVEKSKGWGGCDRYRVNLQKGRK